VTTSTVRRPIPWGQVALLLLALAEVAVAILIGQWIGAGWTILALLGLSALGLSLLAREGRSALAALTGAGRAAGTRGPGTGQRTATPGAAGSRGGRVLAGLLLFIPGFVTAAAGLLLLLPPVQTLAGRLLQDHLARRGAGPGPASGGVVQGEIVVTDVQVSDLREVRARDAHEPGPPREPGSPPEIADDA
jgi:UPF0716 protein FxsA